MSDISVTVKKRSQEVLLRIPKLTDTYKRNIEQALKEIGSDVQYEIRRLLMLQNKTGRMYRFRGGWHRASAPGQAPANMTGRLHNSVNYSVHNPYHMTIGESMDYATYLENGTKRMAPRPHMILAIQNMQAQTYITLLAAGKIST